MFGEREAHTDPELSTCLAKLKQHASRIDAAMTSLHAYVKAVSIGGAGAKSVIAVGDVLKQYVADYWDAYDEAVRLMNGPTPQEVRAVLKAIERAETKAL